MSSGVNDHSLPGRGRTRPRAAPVSLSRLWIGVAAAPVAWTIAELAGYVLVARSCESGPNGMRAYGVENPGLALALFGLLMAAIGAYGLYVAWDSYRRIPRGDPGDLETQIESGAEDPANRGSAPEWGRTRFMAHAGLITSSLFLLGTLLFVVPTFLLNNCSQVR